MALEKPVPGDYWPENAACGGETPLVIEQVSHHQPNTDYCTENLRKGHYLDGMLCPEDEFQHIIMKQVGHAVLTVSLPSGETEEYLITLPRLRIDGLNIQSSIRYLSTIEYKDKGHFSGRSHPFKSMLTLPPHNHASPHVIEGTWHTTSEESHSGVAFHDITSPKEESTESRKLWHGIAKGIREGDFERRRSRYDILRRRDESAAGATWELKHFKHVEHDPVYERLGKFFKANLPTEDGYIYLGNGPSS
ncbi:hypothetical protein EV424DRAFT_1474363 [Suillus variegatus]|nr:hypothetical protein EV424DRAFT_1474363 [Suillus variegatus]